MIDIKGQPWAGWTRLACLALTCLVLLPAVARAQGSISGVVRDTSGAVLPGVTVEAASPALIEKVRSVVSDGNGQYRVVDLRPGTYSLTFTLVGFSSVKRDGLELTGSFGATVNAELRVGAVTETITVTGEAPIVDVQNNTQERVFQKEVIDAIPAGRSHAQIAVLIPGVTGTNPDVGGSNTLGLTSLGIHGSRSSDMRVTANGVNLRNIGSPGSLISLMPDMASTQEVVVDYGGGSAEMESAGLQIKYIPRDGGNKFSGMVFGTYVGPDFQSSNYTPELKSAGLTAPNSLKRLYDFDGAGGGPIKRDALWFYSAVRWQANENYLPGIYFNLNAGDPTKWTYEPDLSRQGFNSTLQSSVNLRLTWQATPKNKFSLYGEHQPRDNGSATALNSPEAASYFLYPKNRLLVAGWTSAVTSKLLIEAHFSDHSEELYNVIPPAGTVFRPGGDVWRTLIPVMEQGGLIPGLLYHGGGIANGPSFLYSRQTGPNLFMSDASLSYITGSHAFKVGFHNLMGNNTNANRTVDSATSYRFNNTVPNQITQYATPNARRSHLTEGYVFAQDKWTVKQLTINAGLRFDYFNTYFPEQFLGPGPLVPNRNITFAAQDWYRWKDLSPRLGLVYDLFGDGKTALKTSVSKYLIAVDPTLGNPYFNLANLVTRSWTDANRDYIPDCDLLNPLLNGECGIISDLRFGGLLPSTTTDPDTLAGWGKKPGSWEFSAAVQHTLLPNVGLNVGYFRRWYDNFTVTDNRLVETTDYSPFGITAPLDPRLPGGGGYLVSGLFNLNPDKVGQVDNYVTFADNFGKQIEHWNGVDVTINARLRQGVMLQGGTSTGRTSTDNCDLVSKLDNPQTLYCHVDTKFLTQIKLLGTYLVPKVDVQFAATFQSLPGAQITANFIAGNALVQPSLGRPLSGGAANVTVNIVEPGTMYSPRVNALDLRLAKIFRLGRTRATVNFDLYNAANLSTVQSQSNNYSNWLQPTGILGPRLFKISGQFDF